MFQNHSYTYPASESPIERLPSELLHMILRSVSSPRVPNKETLLHNLPVEPNANAVPSPCLLSCLLTCRTLLAAALPIMYRDVKVSRLLTLSSFLSQLTTYPDLGNSVRKMDISNISSTNPSAILDEVSNPLLEAIAQTPLVRKIRIDKSLAMFMNGEVLHKLFCGMPYLETLDLSNCNSPEFFEACINLFSRNPKITRSFVSITLAGCTDLPSEIFENLLPQFPNLRHLDVSKTQISSAALFSIPSTSRLYHLNLSHCYALDRVATVNFLTQSPSSKSLVYLSLECLPGLEHQLFNDENISRIVSNLPLNIQTLNLKNSAFNSIHLPHFRKILAQLEELSVGAQLRLGVLESLFSGPKFSNTRETVVEARETEPRESKYHTVLTPMEEAIAICKLRRRINFLFSSSNATTSPKLRYLDLSGLPVLEQCKIQTSILLGEQTKPLQVIEISEEVLGRCGESLARLCAAVGWDVVTVGRRCWMRRR